MWLTWSAIALILAGGAQEALWLFVDGNALMWSGAGCVILAVAALAAQSRFYAD